MAWAIPLIAGGFAIAGGVLTQLGAWRSDKRKFTHEDKVRAQNAFLDEAKVYVSLLERYIDMAHEQDFDAEQEAQTDVIDAKNRFEISAPSKVAIAAIELLHAAQNVAAYPNMAEPVPDKVEQYYLRKREAFVNASRKELGQKHALETVSFSKAGSGQGPLSSAGAQPQPDPSPASDAQSTGD